MINHYCCISCGEVRDGEPADCTDDGMAVCGQCADERAHALSTYEPAHAVEGVASEPSPVDCPHCDGSGDDPDVDVRETGRREDCPECDGSGELDREAALLAFLAPRRESLDRWADR